MVPFSICILFIWHIYYRWRDFSRSTRPVWRANSICGQENRSWGRRRGRRTWGCQVIYIFTKRRDLQLFWRFFFRYLSRTRQISESSSKEGKKKKLGSRAKKLIKSKTSKGGSVRLRHTSSGGSSTDIYHPTKSKLPGKIIFLT